MPAQAPRGGWHVTPQWILAEATVGHRRPDASLGPACVGLRLWLRHQSAMSHYAVQRPDGAAGGAV
jgi:hypothetical protein